MIIFCLVFNYVFAHVYGSLIVLLQHTCNCFFKFGLTYDLHMAATSLWRPLLSSPTSGRHRQVRLYIARVLPGARCSSVVRSFVHGAKGRRIEGGGEAGGGGPIELYLVPASAPRLV